MPYQTKEYFGDGYKNMEEVIECLKKDASKKTTGLHELRTYIQELTNGVDHQVYNDGS